MTGSTRRRPLDSRPKLPPGLALTSRAPAQAQLGQSLVVHGTEQVYQQLAALDGRHSYTELLQTTPEPDTFRMLIERLDELRLLEDAEYPPRLAGDLAARATHGADTARLAETRAKAVVAVHGDGRIAIATAAALAAAGVGWVHPATAGTVRAEDCGTGYRDADIGSRRARVAPELLRAASSTARFDKLPPGRAPDLVVFTDTPVPSPQAVAPLQLAGVPQLLAYARDEVGVVGPLVVPGRTGCTRCIDLWRTARDPCWPRIATQQAGVPQPCPLAVANAVSSFACAQALRFIDGDPLDGLRDAAVDIEPDELSLRKRRWRPHPSCSCGGAATPQQGSLGESQPAVAATSHQE